MMTNLQNVAARPVAADSDDRSMRTLWSRAVGHLQAAVCGLHGHDPMLHFEQGRMFLRCTSCGFETPGWDTGDRRPRVRFEGDARRHRLHESSKVRPRPVA